MPLRISTPLEKILTSLENSQHHWKILNAIEILNGIEKLFDELFLKVLFKTAQRTNTVLRLVHTRPPIHTSTLTYVDYPIPSGECRCRLKTPFGPQK